MNGKIFNPQATEDSNNSFLEQVKKSEEAKKRKNFQWISIILLSNIMVACLSYSSPPIIVPSKEIKKYLLHPGFHMMILTITPLIQVDQTVTEQKVSLLNSKSKIILPLAFLHEEIKNESDPGITRFKIEIPDGETLKVSALSEEKLLAIPAVKAVHSKRIEEGSSYEINL